MRSYLIANVGSGRAPSRSASAPWFGLFNRYCRTLNFKADFSIPALAGLIGIGVRSIGRSLNKQSDESLCAF